MVDANGTEIAPQVLEQVQEYVAEHCPDLADGEYSVQERKPHSPSEEMLNKLHDTAPREAQPANQVRESRPAYAVAPAPAHYANGRTAIAIPPVPSHYTITLRKDVRTDSGAILPRIARFVVDGSGHILRATASKLPPFIWLKEAENVFPGGQIARF